MSEQSGTTRTHIPEMCPYCDEYPMPREWAFLMEENNYLQSGLTAAQSALAAEKEARAIIPPSYLQLTAERNDAIERADAAEAKLAKVERVVEAAKFANWCPDAGGYKGGRSIEDCYEELHNSLCDYFGTSYVHRTPWITEAELDAAIYALSTASGEEGGE